VLASKKTPEAVVNQALELAHKGETITHAKAKALVKDYRDWAGERVEQPTPPREDTEPEIGGYQG